MQHMTAEQWQQIKSLLERTLERPADERASWLERECTDPLTRSEVWSLVQAHSEVQDFLEQPADASQQFAAALAPESLVGERIGPWRLVEEVGRGGMGTVYRAVRADDEFHREVAIKIVTRGYDTELLQRRFRTERQILANLEHPYIARLLDGGTTSDGRPYFVMEYVQGGVPLTDYCDRQRLDINRRIELFRKVCSAVAYAHENLIVHRDLKPANILVTPAGIPKLLDFGIARLLNSSGRDISEPTVTMLRMATPAYASPEQIRGSVAGIPSDIYSLGVILYELLTGHRPYRLPTDDLAGDLARVICEREPTRASIVIGFTESVERAGGDIVIVTPERVADARDTTLDQLRRKIRGDLDNITAMALRKEPHRRYESVERFSQDLHRHLAGLPIVAARDTLGYRAGKFIERNRLAVAAGAVAALLLCVASVVALHKANRLSHRLEEDQRLATSFLVEVHDTIAQLPGSTPAREAILQQSLKYLDGLSRDAGDEPNFRRSLAMAWEKFAELQIGVQGPGLGRSADALVTCRKALAIRESLAEKNPQDASLQYELANNYLLAAYIAGRAGGVSLRREFDRKALEISERLTALDPRNRDYRAALARAHTNIAYPLQYEDKWDSVRIHLNKALAIHTELAAENPSDEAAQRELAQVQYRLGTSYVEAGQSSQATEYLRQALAIQTKLAEADPENINYRADRAATHHYLGYALGSLAQTQEALRHFDKAIELRRALLAQDPRDTRNRYMLAGNYSKRAAVLLQAKELDAALESARTAVELQELALAYDPKGVPARISMAEFENRLASIYMALAEATGKASHWTDAESLFRRALERYDALIAEGNLTSPGIRADAEEARASLARCEARRRH